MMSCWSKLPEANVPLRALGWVGCKRLFTSCGVTCDILRDNAIWLIDNLHIFLICECLAKSIPENMTFSRGVTKNMRFIGFVTKINPKRPERSPNLTKWSPKGTKREPKPPKWSPKGAKREPKGHQECIQKSADQCPKKVVNGTIARQQSSL